MRRASKLITTQILPLLLLIGAGGFVWLSLQDKQLLSVQTGSMIPSIRPGHLVVVSPIKPNNLGVGDVITFQPNQETFETEPPTITHRVIETPNLNNGYQYITKGDANSTPDLPVSSNMIVGKVDFSIPYVGYAANIVSNPVGLLIAVYIPATLIILDEIRRLSRHFLAESKKFSLPKNY